MMYVCYGYVDDVMVKQVAGTHAQLARLAQCIIHHVSL